MMSQKIKFCLNSNKLILLGVGGIVKEIPAGGSGSVNVYTLDPGIYAVRQAQTLNIYPSEFYSYEFLLIKPFAGHAENSIWIHGIRGVFTLWSDRWISH